MSDGFVDDIFFEKDKGSGFNGNDGLKIVKEEPSGLYLSSEAKYVEDPKNVLKNYYDTVEKMDNGYYHGTKTWKLGDSIRTEEIFVPAELDEKTTFSAYIPGAGGAEKDAMYVREMFKGKNPPKCVTVIASDSFDSGNALELGTKIINKCGSKVDKFFSVGFSLGVRNDLSLSDSYIAGHPEVANSSMVFVTDGVLIEKGASISDYKTLKKYNVPIIYMSGEDTTFYSDQPYGNKNKIQTALNEFGKAGYNIFAIRSTDNNHNGLNIAATRYILPFIFGTADDIVTKKGGVPNETVSYDFLRYNPKTKKIELISSSGKDPTGISFLKLGLLGKKKRKALLQVTELEKIVNDYRRNTTSLVASNMNYVINNMNKIRNGIATTTFLSDSIIVGSEGIPNLIATNVNRYYGNIEDVLTKLEQETRSAASIGYAINDMDIDLAKHADNIHMLGKIVDVEEPKQDERKDKSFNA